MDWSNIESSWKDYQADARKRWNKLAGDLLVATRGGKRGEVSSRVQEAYGGPTSAPGQQSFDWQSSRQAKQAPAADGPK